MSDDPDLLMIEFFNRCLEESPRVRTATMTEMITVYEATIKRLVQSRDELFEACQESMRARQNDQQRFIAIIDMMDLTRHQYERVMQRMGIDLPWGTAENSLRH